MKALGESPSFTDAKTQRFILNLGSKMFLHFPCHQLMYKIKYTEIKNK